MQISYSALGFSLLASFLPYLVAERHGEEVEGFPEKFFLVKRKGKDYSAGCLLSWDGRSVVRVGSGFYKRHPLAQRFAILHECGHLRHRDQHMSAVLNMICLVAAHVFFPSRIFLSFLGLSALAGRVHAAIYERRADAFARKHASIDELKAYINDLWGEDWAEIQWWENANTVSSLGSYFLWSFRNHIWTGHPTADSRIKACLKEVESRGSTTFFLKG